LYAPRRLRSMRYRLVMRNASPLPSRLTTFRPLASMGRSITQTRILWTGMFISTLLARASARLTPTSGTAASCYTRTVYESNVLDPATSEIFCNKQPDVRIIFRQIPAADAKTTGESDGLMELYAGSLTNIPRYKHHHRGPQPHSRPAGNHVASHCHCRCHRYQFRFQCPE
jgi:hypothetical protein